MRRALPLLLLMMLGSAMALPAGAEDGAPQLEDLQVPSSVPEGTPRLSIEGRMTVSAQPEVQLWTDPAFGSSGENFNADPDIDLISGRVRHSLPADPVAFSWKVAPPLPGGNGAVRPSTELRWGFQLGGRRTYVGFWNEPYPDITQGRLTSWIYDCVGSTCTSSRPLSGATFDPATRTARILVPLGELAAGQPGGVLVQTTMAQLPSGYEAASAAWRCNANCGSGFSIGLDSVSSIASYELPVASVFAGITPPDAVAEEVAFSPLGVTLNAGSLEVAFGGDLKLGYRAPGEYLLWLKACFGPCAVQALPLVVT